MLQEGRPVSAAKDHPPEMEPPDLSTGTWIGAKKRVAKLASGGWAETLLPRESREGMAIVGVISERT